jgi:aminoglycoside phosphotransferase (APT) family kinase protein
MSADPDVHDLPNPDGLRAAPSHAALSWITEEVRPGSRVIDVHRLTGGVSSSMHVVRLVDASGTRSRVVLRRWVGLDVVEGAVRVRTEASVLSQLSGTVLAAPALLAADPTGDACGEPALAMTWLPGRLHLTPEDPEHWLTQMAGALAGIHDADVVAPSFSPWLDLDALQVPEWTRQPSLWRDAFGLARQPPPAGPECFVHGDFQQFNVLWRGDRLASVVDWTSSSRGSPTLDVAHCRLNLALLYTPERAERFRTLYESMAGTATEPWWDLTELVAYVPGWGATLQRQAGRRLRIDVTGMHDRVEQLLATVLRRL